VIPSSRVASNYEVVQGSFRAPQDGTLYLEFDNSYSWFTPKLLSYTVELFQPAFSLADQNRCSRSISLLASTIEDSRRAELRLAKVFERIKILSGELPILEDRYNALLADLNNKKANLENAQREAREIKARIDINLEKQNGLCIRCLTKPVLTRVLSTIFIYIDIYNLYLFLSIFSSLSTLSIIIIYYY
jgi:hypothetical protein